NVKIRNSKGDREAFDIHTVIYDAEGKEISRTTIEGANISDTLNSIDQEMKVQNPNLWSVENPYLYKVVTLVEQDGQLIDKYETPLGIRYFNFDVEKGFSLNGEPVKIKGVCNHHDLGALGAA